MKYRLSLLILLALSVKIFSRVRISLAKRPGTLPRRGSYYIAAVTANRHGGKKERVIGRLYGVVGSQDIRLKKAAAAQV